MLGMPHIDLGLTWYRNAPRHRRPPRKVTKRRNRDCKLARRMLVHAAGCVYRFSSTPGCCTFEPEDFADYPQVRVPRSLRSTFGEYVGFDP